MAETETKSISWNEEPKKQGPFAPLFSLFPNIHINLPHINLPHINLPQFKRESKVEEVVQKVGEEPKSEKPDVVRVPESRRDLPVLKLENEEAGKESGGGIMWQVYALGGFMLVRWAWAKWQEKKANEKQSDKKETEDGDGDGDGDGDQKRTSPEDD